MATATSKDKVKDLANEYVTLDDKIKALTEKRNAIRTQLDDALQYGESVVLHESLGRMLTKNETLLFKPDADSVAWLKEQSLWARVRKVEVDKPKAKKLMKGMTDSESLVFCSMLNGYSGSRFTIKR